MIVPDVYQTGQKLRVQRGLTQGLLPFPWAEYVSRTPSTQAYRFQTDQTQATFSMEVYWDDFINNGSDGVVPRILGYPSVVDGIGNTITRISRSLPMAHPLFPWLYATAITDVRGIKQTGIKNGLSSYDRAILTIAFTSLNYNILSDAQLPNFSIGANEFPNESLRFVVKHPKPKVEYISLDRYFFKYAEGVSPPNGNTFPLGIGKITVKVDLEWTWCDVPDRAIFDSNGYAPRIYPLMGTVNSVAFAGCDPGTLLFYPPEFTPRMAPVSPDATGILSVDSAGNISNVPRTWDVRFRFGYWDPAPRGVPAGSNKGWNLAIWPGDQKFYLVQSSKGNNLFEPGAFLNAFAPIP